MDVSNLQLQPQVLGGVTQPVSPAIIGIVDNILNMQFNPFQSVIVVKRSEYDMLQEGGRAWLAEHLSHTLEKDVIWVEDGTSAMERYFVGPIEEFICENRMLINIDGGAVLVERPTSKGILDKIRGEEKSKRKPQRISRPPNAYILYRKDHHQMIKAAHPSYTNNDISKVLGSAWKNESEEVREKYHRMANEIKQDLMRAHPEYRYTPRRPHERRRRARRIQTGNV